MKFNRNKKLSKLYNFMCRRFSNRINTVCILVLTFMFAYYTYTYYDFHYVYKPKPEKIFNTKKNFSILSSLRLVPRCLCQKETILIREYKDHYNIMIENDIDSLFFSYNLTRQIFNSLVITCDLYKVLRRGPNQHIISYSIIDYSDISLKYIFKTNIKRAKVYYPNWIVRVYHKGILSQNEECELECLRDTKNELLDNVDVCDAVRIPIDFHETWNASYILSSVLKFLPVGDDMVHAFVCRSVVSCIFDREVSAVNEWLISGRHFHVMRDHPDHARNIISDLWGFVNNHDRKFSKYMLNIFTDKRINKWYRSINVDKNPDELILEKYIWPLINSLIIHDSYNCKKSDNYYPFPTKRNPPNCHVGMIGCCGSKITDYLEYYKCPKQCRPKKHINEWVYC